MTSAFDVPCNCLQCGKRMWVYNLAGRNPVNLTDNAEPIHYTCKEKILTCLRKLKEVINYEKSKLYYSMS